jgi:hypothetical protein
MVAVPVAGLVDLVGTSTYLILREGTGWSFLETILLLGRGRFLVNSDIGIRHFNSYSWNGIREVKTPVPILQIQDRTGVALSLRLHERQAGS